MRNRGFTLVELLIVMAIMGILMTIATLAWNEMQRKAAVETQAKTMFVDLMQVRLQALYSKTPRSVVISGQQFKVYSSQVVSVTPVETKQLRFPVAWSSGGGTLDFDTHGLMNGSEGSVCIVPTSDLAVVNTAAVDSIVVSAARMNLGKRTGVLCNAENIDQK